jgi:hypothetical protein
VDNAGDVDSIGSGLIKNYIRPHNKCAQVLAKVFPPLTQFRLNCEPF